MRVPGVNVHRVPNPRFSGDNNFLRFGDGSPARFGWDTTDANANHLMLEMPAGGAVDVPVLLIGRGIIGNDLGVYQSVTVSTIGLWENSTGTEAPVFEFRKSRGSAGTPTVVVTGDNLGAINAYGYSGAGGYVESGSIEFDSEGAIVSTTVGGVIRLRTANTATPSVLTTAMVIDSLQRVTVLDDLLMRFGTDGDGVVAHSSVGVGANTALTGVLIGTPVISASAANSIYLANITASGDIILAANRGGNSESYLFIDTSAGDLALYSRGTGSFDVYDDATQVLDFVSGTFAFQQATTVRTAAGDLILTTVAASTDLVLRGIRRISVDTVPIGISNAVGAPSAVADLALVGAVDIAAGDARLAIQAEAGGLMHLGNNEIRNSTDLTLQTIAASTDLILDPTRAVVVTTGAARVAVADQVSYFVVDIAGGDARIGFQAEAGGIIYIGNNAIRMGANNVLGVQGAAVADASGGATIDAEARTAINTFLARARTHGLIAT